MSISFFQPDPAKDYFMFYKPDGCITAQCDAKHPTIMQYLEDLAPLKLHPLGRLDKDTTGLLLLTNDGAFTHYLMSPENHISKTYLFYALGTLDSVSISNIERGIYFMGDEKITAPCQLHITGNDILQNIFPMVSHTKYRNLFHKHPKYHVTIGTLTITEGRKHHVKKLLKFAKCYVISLKRISIGHLQLDETLSPGEYRRLTPTDFSKLL